MFSASGQTPCVGVSIGIERVLTIMEKRLQEERGDKGAPANVQVPPQIQNWMLTSAVQYDRACVMKAVEVFDHNIFV